MFRLNRVPKIFLRSAGKKADRASKKKASVDSAILQAAQYLVDHRPAKEIKTKSKSKLAAEKRADKIEYGHEHEDNFAETVTYNNLVMSPEMMNSDGIKPQRTFEPAPEQSGLHEMVLKLSVQPFEKLQLGIRIANPVFEMPIIFDVDKKVSDYKKIYVREKLKHDNHEADDAKMHFYLPFHPITKR